MVTGPPAASTASLARAKLATCSGGGFLSFSISPFSALLSIDHCVRLGSRPPLTDQTQFLVSTSMAYSTASCGLSVAFWTIGTTFALSRNIVRLASIIAANRTMFRDKAKVVPIVQKATDKPHDAVEYAIDVLTKNCVWSVNGGLDPKRTQWSIDNSAENGDIEKDKKPPPEQVANFALAKEAVEAAGGPVTIGN